MRRVFLIIVLQVVSLTFLHARQIPLFEETDPKKTGVTFSNVLTETPASNVLTYEYFFNGGGVAAGDINNDGLDDIYLVGNMVENKLYLNQGDFSFKDITETAGVAINSGWKTSANMVDINGDGLIDIYVCLSGKGDPEHRRNQLLINNGDLTFTNRAAEYGLDDPSHSTHSAFFDFDNDGDLDMYLLNHNVVVIREFEFASAKATRHPYAGDKLFRNDTPPGESRGVFVDVSEAAGIKGNPLGFGLGVNIADINQDGWQDIYVSNDYIEPDYVYINNGDGTFTDRLTEYMQHISYFSMGCDISDFNNDGWPDIFTLDMLPEDNKRQKLLYGPENYEHFALMVMNGFYFQNMRNMLHLNNKSGPDGVATYSEIGQLAGISNTDWSWSPLFADFDNDGWKDLFVSNGYYRDYTNRDFLKYKGDYYFQMAREKQKADTFHLVTSMTSTPVHNYIYKNNGDLTFSDKSKDWGFTQTNFSSGAVYTDLDNDGDLDLIVNNQNQTAGLFKNRSRENNPDVNYLAISLEGSGKNTRALGAKVSLYANGGIQYFEQMTTRGFQSSVSPRIHAGLGNATRVDSIEVQWLGGTRQVLYDIAANQVLKIVQDPGLNPAKKKAALHTASAFTKVQTPVAYEHIEYGFNDFKRQPLLMTMLTACGPVMAVGDVNSDGLDDVFVGGTQENPGELFLQYADGQFGASGLFQTKEDLQYTDADALFFDADGDGDLDLYIVSGGYNDYNARDPALQDRLYLNSGNGSFSRSVNSLPDMLVSKSVVAAVDFDQDGDLDLFVGGRVVPGNYPVVPENFLLENDGKGHFTVVTEQKAPGLEKIGMVTDSEWADVNGDGWVDLIVIGEYMTVEVFLNKNGRQLQKATNQVVDQSLSGLWSTMAAHDFDKDGDTDFIVGNFGLNSQLKASEKEPLSLVYKDFDKNGSIDPILICYIAGQPYPFASRDELLDQMYSMRSKFTDYESYSNAQLHTIFSKSDLKDANEYKASYLQSIYLENKNGKLVAHPLPYQAQFAPVYAISLLDYNNDGNMDVVLAGNQSSIRIRMGVIDANFGQLYEGDGKGGFSYISQPQSGLSLIGDTKSLKMVDIDGAPYLLVGVNNVGIEAYKLNGL